LPNPVSNLRVTFFKSDWLAKLHALVAIDAYLNEDHNKNDCLDWTENGAFNNFNLKLDRIKQVNILNTIYISKMYYTLHL
jgi:hypothetical protein